MNITPKNVTFMPADPKFEQKDIRKQHLRVAPYCRVSTDKEEQLSSYEAQIEYYTARIADNPEWTMVRLYADEGKSGTSTKKRKAFNQLIADCEKGRIDLVITKSVSRFGRNTLDGIQYVRKLKRLGIGVYFEKENVNTLYMDNEMILTFFFSQAQSESESLSKIVSWGHRRNFEKGKVYYQYKKLHGLPARAGWNAGDRRGAGRNRAPHLRPIPHGRQRQSDLQGAGSGRHQNGAGQ